jgi:hypothetical protein
MSIRMHVKLSDTLEVFMLPVKDFRRAEELILGVGLAEAVCMVASLINSLSN